MISLQTLYQEVIIDHNRAPRNFHKIEDADCFADGFNPLCGDKVSVYLKISGNIITDVSFQGCGCAISTASASLMTESLKGKSLEEAKSLFEKFHLAVTEDKSDDEALGKLIALTGVREFPSRVKCATLAWHTLNAAMQSDTECVSTE